MTSTSNASPAKFITHPEQPGVRVMFEWIDADVARLYLDELPEAQRPRSNVKIKEYVRTKQLGLWHFNGDTLSFDVDGRCLNGQHRLTAIIESGVGSYELTVHGLASAIIEVQDLLTPRTFYTWLRRHPKPTNPSICRQLTGMIWHWEHGNYAYRDAPRVQFPEYSGMNGSTPELQQVWHLYAQHIELAASHGGQLAYRIRRGRNAVLRGPLAMAWLMLRQIDLNKAEMFFWILKDEEARIKPENRAIRILHTELVDSIDNPKDRTWVLLHFIFHAWNLWISGAEITGTGNHFRRPPRPETRFLAMPTTAPKIPGKPSSVEEFEFFRRDPDGQPILPPIGSTDSPSTTDSDDTDNEEN